VEIPEEIITKRPEKELRAGMVALVLSSVGVAGI
jgi:hypothetical protein